MKLSVIVAVSENGVIGKDNDLPWHLPADLKRFKSLTMGHPMIMGRKTYESIGRPLPGRRSLVLTRSPGFIAEGVTAVHSLDEAIGLCEGEDEVFVIGGASVFAETLSRADRLYLTRVHATIDGQIHFAEDGLEGWALLEEERHPSDERHRYPFTFQTYQRRDT